MRKKLISAISILMLCLFTPLMNGEMIETMYEWRLIPRPVFIPLGETSAYVLATVPPVFAAAPSQDVNAGVYVDPSGEINGVVRSNSEEEIVFSACLKASKFANAQIASKPAWGYLRVKATSYFYVEGTQDLSSLPKCSFRMNALDLQALYDLAPKNGKDKHNPQADIIKVSVSVDENGVITKFSGNDKRAKTVIEKGLKKIAKTLQFIPATKNGKNVQSELIFVIGQNDGTPKRIACAIETAPDQISDMPIGYAGTEECEVTCYVTYKADGLVDTVRAPANLDANCARTIMGSMRKWINTKELRTDYFTPVVATTLRLTPGETKIMYARPPYIVPFDLPMLPAFNTMNWMGMPINKPVNAKATWVVDENGNVSEAKLVEASMPIFGSRIKSVLKKATSSKGTFDGRAESFFVSTRLYYGLREEDTNIYR